MWIPISLLGMGCAAVTLVAAGVMMTASGPAVSADGGLLDFNATAAVLIQPVSFALVPLPKPTYTATPTIVPPTPVITEDPETAVVAAEIVVDTPTSEYLPPSEEEPAAAYEAPPQPSYAGNKYILVDISEQHLYAYGNQELVYSFVASTGMNNATAVGNFSVLEKIPNAYGSTWDIWMPNWLGIYWSGGLQNGIHALPVLSNGVTLWSGFLGRPISYGCVVLDTYESQLLYDWADVGTPVEIQW